MRQTIFIAAATIREHSRRKLIAFFVIFSVVATGAIVYLAQNESAKKILTVSGPGGAQVIAGFLSLFALLAALATSMGNVGGPVASGEAQAVLARPVSRAQYVVGRFLAGAGVTTVLCALMFIEMQLIQVVAGGSPSSKLWGFWGATAFNLWILSAIATLLSAIVSTPIIVAVITYLANVAIGAGALLKRFSDLGFIKGSLALIGRTLWYITPKFLTPPSLAGGRGLGTRLTVDNSAGLTVWACAWLAGLVAAAILLVYRKDL